MTIAFLASFHFHQQYTLAKELVKLGHTVIYIGKLDSPRYGKEEQTLVCTTLSRPICNNTFMGWSLSDLDMCRAVDIVYSADQGCSRSSVSLAESLGVPLVIHVFDLVEDPNFWGYSTIYEEHKQLVDNFYPKATELFTINPATSAQLGLRGFATVCIPHPIDTELFDRFCKNQPKICDLAIISNFYPWKKVELAIDSALKINKEITVIGTGPLVKQLRLSYKRNKLVRFLGEVSDQIKAQCLCETKVHIYPQMWPEAPGIIPQEALYCGAQSVSFDYPAQRFIDGNFGHYVQVSLTDNVKAMSMMIDQALANSNLSDTAAAKQFISSQLSYKRIAFRIASNLQRLL